MQKAECGASSIACVAEPDAYATILDQLSENIHSYIAEDPGDRNAEFAPQRMVAL